MLLTPAGAQTFTSSSGAVLGSSGMVSCTAFGKTMGLGDGKGNKKSDEVLKLQAFLFEKGHLKVSPTGNFGTLTREAVREFQKSQGIAQTGFVGNLTLAALKAHFCKNEEPIAMCSYAKPPAGCEYKPGKDFNPKTNCGLELSCSSATSTVSSSCKVWFDGCNTCSRSSASGAAMCTLMYCFEQKPAYCISE